MKKYIKFIVIFTNLILSLYTYQKGYFNVYAIELENKIDLLIEKSKCSRRIKFSN